MTLDLDFKGKYIISGRIVLDTGLHIGGTTEGFEIGGLDNPVIRDPLSEVPYIPGSSLKGKLRHLLEWSLGKIEAHPKHRSYTAHFCGECAACIIFGPASDDHEVRVKAGPSRLTVRDAFPTRQTVDMWDKYLGERTFTELKNENVLDRVTSEANPRTMERVPAGSEFNLEMIFDLYRDSDRELLNQVLAAMHLLENSALGGSGSRGYGKIKFVDVQIKDRSRDYYLGRGTEVERLLAERAPEKEFPEEPDHHVFKKGLSGTIPYNQSLPGHIAANLGQIFKAG